MLFLVILQLQHTCLARICSSNMFKSNRKAGAPCSYAWSRYIPPNPTCIHNLIYSSCFLLHFTSLPCSLCQTSEAMGGNLCHFSGESEESSEISESDGGLNINTATIEDLTDFGVGRAMASRIVHHREQFGPFQQPADLNKVPYMRKKLAEKLGQEMSFDAGYTGWTCDITGCTSCSCYNCLTWGSCGGCLPCFSCSCETEEAIFFPDEGHTGLSQIIELIESAKNTLDVAVFSISHKDLAAALVDAQKCGVHVRVLTDDVQAKHQDSCVKMLKKAGIQFRMDSNEKMHMHHKFMVVDGSTLMSGSLNWTHAAVERGNENVVISKNHDLCEDFTSEFDRLWKQFVKKQSDLAPAGCFKGNVASLFFPSVNGNNAQIIHHELEMARDSIDVAVFTLTLDSLVDILIRKHKAGLRVRVITDNRQANVRGADAQRLKDTGVPVRTDRSFYAMHHKFAIIDGTTLINGSFNWTAQASHGNQENVVIFRNYRHLAGEFLSEFQHLWDTFKPWFHSTGDDRSIGMTKRFGFACFLQLACHTCPKIDIRQYILKACENPKVFGWLAISWYTEGWSQCYQQLQHLFIGNWMELGYGNFPPGNEWRIRYGPFGHWPYGRSAQARFGRCWSISPSNRRA